MRLVFISSVTASTPLRTISVSTASAPRAPAPCAASCARYARFIGCGVISASLADLDDEIAEGVHLHAVAGQQHGGRGVLLDQRRPVDAVAGAQRVAREGRRGDRLAELGEIHAALAARARPRAARAPPRAMRSSGGFFITPVTVARRLTISARSSGAQVP